MLVFNMPTLDERKEILQIIFKKIPNCNVSLDYLAEITEGLSGAEPKGIRGKSLPQGDL